MSKQERTLHWQQQLEHWQDSGLSGSVFCRQHGLPYHQFTYWRRKLQETGSEPDEQPTSAGFARVTCRPTPPPAELTLTLPSGLRLTGLHAGNVELLGAILRQL